MLNVIKRRFLGDPSRLVLRPPKPDPDRTGVGLVAIVKNEERHILDWMIFHAIAGVREIILYDNGSSDATVEIAKSFRTCPVTVIPWIIDIGISRSNIGLKRQNLAYAHAICNFGARFRWLTFIDIDEYLVPLQADTIEAALTGMPEHPNIALPWSMFGTSGHTDLPDDPIPLAYRQRARSRAGKLLNFKCILDPCEVTEVQVHKFRTAGKGTEYMNDHGVLASDSSDRLKKAFLESTALQLNHYYTFSERELEEKMAKGGVSDMPDNKRRENIRAIVEEIERDLVPDHSAPDFLARHGIHDAAGYRKVS